MFCFNYFQKCICALLLQNYYVTITSIFTNYRTRIILKKYARGNFAQNGIHATIFGEFYLVHYSFVYSHTNTQVYINLIINCVKILR